MIDTFDKSDFLEALQPKAGFNIKWDDRFDKGELVYQTEIKQGVFVEIRSSIGKNGSILEADRKVFTNQSLRKTKVVCLLIVLTAIPDLSGCRDFDHASLG